MIAARTPTDTEVALATIVRPVFIAPVSIETSQTGTVAWTTYDASASIPAGAVAAIVEYDWAMSGPNSGDVDANVWGRSNGSGSAYLVARGRSAGASDDVAGAGQCMIPLDGQSFDYLIEDPGFGGGCSLRLIGYWG